MNVSMEMKGRNSFVFPYCISRLLFSFGGRTAASWCVIVCVCVCVYDELDRNVEGSWHMSLNYPGVLLTERKEKNRVLLPVVPTT